MTSYPEVENGKAVRPTTGIERLLARFSLDK